MPLRLTGTDTPQAPAEPLGPRARSLLLGGDLAGYRALAGEVSEGDGHYADTVTLIEAGLLAVNGLSGQARTQVLAAVAEIAITALELAPAEPVLLGYAGVACHELWVLDGALALLRAARRLDPALAHLESNLAAVQRRRRGPQPLRPMHPSAPGLGRRAVALARRAQPASGMTISLCMIVRDEEAALDRCLASVRDGVDEIVVVDTGSRDATREIAARHGARVIEHPWTGSFAEARNVSLEAATGDWLLFLDADEVLAGGDAERLRGYAGHTWREALFLSETSFIGEFGDGTAINHLALRMFRNRPAYRFTGAIHEQIAPALPTATPGRIGMSALRLDHYGYLGDVRRGKEKFRRNLELLRRQEAELGASPFLHYNIGTEYGGAGDFGAAASHLATAWTLLEREGTLVTAEYGPLLVAGLVRALRAIDRPEDAETRARAGLELFGEFTDLVWEQATIALHRGEIATARTRYERCLEMGDAPARYGGQTGMGTYLARAALASIALEHEHDPARARTLLESCLADHPGYAAAAGPYATAALRTGADPAAVLRTLETCLGSITPAVRHAVAGALRSEGHPEAAAGQYRALLDDDPADALRGSARAALAEILLARGDLEAAAAEAAAVANESGRSALACRIETCARLAGGDVGRGREALARAAAVGLPAAEAEMFEAWIALAGGEPARSLPIASVPLLATLLELMLGAGAPGAVDALSTLLGASRLPQRDQRQLLAEARLRHGDLAGAAAQWMEVCQQAPDAPALLGLAQVAVRHDMPADALTFAAAALELDPGCAPARELVEALTPTSGPAPRNGAAEVLDR